MTGELRARWRELKEAYRLASIGYYEGRESLSLEAEIVASAALDAFFEANVQGAGEVETWLVELSSDGGQTWRREPRGGGFPGPTYYDEQEAREAAHRAWPFADRRTQTRVVELVRRSPTPAPSEGLRERAILVACPRCFRSDRVCYRSQVPSHMYSCLRCSRTFGEPDLRALAATEPAPRGEVRERTLRAIVEAGVALQQRDLDEAYHVLYWLLVDVYGVEQLPDGPFVHALSTLGEPGLETRSGKEVSNGGEPAPQEEAK